jgi:hypothetical protein
MLLGQWLRKEIVDANKYISTGSIPMVQGKSTTFFTPACYRVLVCVCVCVLLKVRGKATISHPSVAQILVSVSHWQYS